jgi:thioredoxin reductase
MENNDRFDVIIIGGSYSGLSAALALGRALRRVLVIDSGEPCNRNTPHSHNFITHDGAVPSQIARDAKKQVMKYETVFFHNDVVLHGRREAAGFILETEGAKTFYASKLICASGIRDLMPDVAGLDACWGKTVLHCPYCHGYEVRDRQTAILGNGEYAVDFTKLIFNWTKDLTLLTNGPSSLSKEQETLILKNNIRIIQQKVVAIEHQNGQMERIVFSDGSGIPMQAVYTKLPFEQHSQLPQQLGCELTVTGHLKVDGSQKTNVHGLFACGDNSHMMRSVSIAAAAGTMAGMMVNKELVEESF